MSLNLKNDSVTLFNQTYMPLKKKIFSISYDIGENHTALTVNYEGGQIHRALMTINPQPYKHDIELCAVIVDHLLKINRGYTA